MSPSIVQVDFDHAAIDAGAVDQMDGALGVVRVGVAHQRRAVPFQLDARHLAHLAKAIGQLVVGEAVGQVANENGGDWCVAITAGATATTTAVRSRG